MIKLYFILVLLIAKSNLLAETIQRFLSERFKAHVEYTFPTPLRLKLFHNFSKSASD